ncbi:MAG: hypothetical protein ABDH63_04995, partial [Candidatus Caldarchaeales archaeon]
RMARKLNVHPRALNYHFNEHVVRKGLVAGHMISQIPDEKVDKGVGKVWLMVNPSGKSPSTLDRVIKEASRPPIICQSFNVLEDGTIALHYVPSMSAVDFFSALDKFSDLVADGATLPLSEASYYALTSELFSENGWSIPAELKQLKKLVNQIINLDIIQ